MAYETQENYSNGHDFSYDAFIASVSGICGSSTRGRTGGQLKIKGTAAVGSELSADYEKVTPEGLTDDYVTFSWSRKSWRSAH